MDIKGEIESSRIAEAGIEHPKIKPDEMVLESILKKHFLAVLLHDLRTPLTAIKASAGLIVRQDSNLDVIHDLANRICNDCGRMDRMIKDFLDVSLIEEREFTLLEITDCELSDLISEVFHSLQSLHSNRLILETKGNLKGYWSPNYLQRVVENLVVNALKYGDSKENITLSLVGEESGVTMSVHNHGNPLSPQQQASLFKPFKRLHVSNSAGKEGWGLGLILVRGIVEAHGGKIKIESSPERGTAFTVNLPRDSRPFQRTREYN